MRSPRSELLWAGGLAPSLAWNVSMEGGNTRQPWLGPRSNQEQL